MVKFEQLNLSFGAVLRAIMKRLYDLCPSLVRLSNFEPVLALEMNGPHLLPSMGYL